MHLFAPGKRLMETYMELEPHFREVGIEINAQGIKSKMETLKRKYFNLLHSDRDDQSTTWRHFDTMTLVVNGNLKDSKDSEWKDYTQPPKTSHITRSSVYMNDPALREYESPFKSVYVDESAVHFFNHEEKPTAKRTRQRFSKATNVRVKPRRVWQPAEEIIFVDVWEKFSGHIQSDRKKMDVYKDMQNELQQLGLIIVPSDIKSKIESLTRSFRTQRNTVGDKSEWIHYSKISQILNPMDFMKFEAFSEPSGNSSSEEDSAWFKEMGPKTEPEPPGNLTNSNDSVVNQFDSSTQPCSPNSSVDFSLIDPDPSHCKVSIEILDQDESIKPIGSPLSEKQKAAEEFSQFVTKELAVLNDDLLIEAKRQIYNIICVLQMKQNEVNKNL